MLHDPAAPSPRRHRPYATTALVALMVAAWYVDTHTRVATGLGPDELPARFVLLGDGPAPWQLVTWAFVHGDGWHLAMNLPGLALFGAACERHVGAWVLLATTLVASTLVGALFVCLDGRDLYGASGLVTSFAAMAFALACARPDARWMRACVALASLAYAWVFDLAPWLRGRPSPGLIPHGLGYAVGLALALALVGVRRRA